MTPVIFDRNETEDKYLRRPAFNREGLGSSSYVRGHLL